MTKICADAAGNALIILLSRLRGTIAKIPAPIQMHIVRILLEVLGTHYMFVRWLTSAQLGSSITNRGNEFESHHIRNLPRLKWNMRTQTCNKSYQVMPVSLLRKGAWVHPDFRDASILWHIKSTQFYMHQDPEQAMGTVAGGNK